MKKTFTTFAIMTLMASLTLSSCLLRSGKGDLRDRNLERALRENIESTPDIRYVGMSDVHELSGGKLEAVIIYYVTDSMGNRTERNVRVTANDDCSQIYAWECLESKTLEDVKQKVTDKFEEKGINISGNLIDALIELKRR